MYYGLDWNSYMLQRTISNYVHSQHVMVGSEESCHCPTAIFYLYSWVTSWSLTHFYHSQQYVKTNADIRITFIIVQNMFLCCDNNKCHCLDKWQTGRRTFDLVVCLETCWSLRFMMAPFKLDMNWIKKAMHSWNVCKSRINLSLKM